MAGDNNIVLQNRDFRLLEEAAIMRLFSRDHAMLAGGFASINRDISVIRHLLFWALDEGFIPSNPLARFRMTRERRKRRSVMPVKHEVTLLHACAIHLAAIVILGLDTGLRRGEIFNQRWEDIDFERKVLHVTLSKTPEGEARPVPLTRRAFELLNRFHKSSGLLFTNHGKPLRSLKTAWKGALRRAGLPFYRFHDLRHSFCSRLVEVGVLADVRRELMGHSSGGDVHSIYTHIDLPLLRDAIARLDTWHTAQLIALSQQNAEAALPQPTNNVPQPKEVA